MKTVNELRQSTGLTQAEFAKKYGLSVSSVAKWERQIRKCPKYVIELIELKMEKEQNLWSAKTLLEQYQNYKGDLESFLKYCDEKEKERIKND